MYIKKQPTFLPLLAVLVPFINTISWACPFCHTSTAFEVREGLSTTMQDQSIWIGMLLPFLATGSFLGIMSRGFIDHKIKTRKARRIPMIQNIKPLKTAGITLGVGMGGFLDGILFHQILQIHNMLSNRYFPDTLVKEQLNMVWDGLFHAFTWVVTAVGLALLWKTAKYVKSQLNTKVFIGSLLLGWGLFNLIEGIIDHEIIGLHHVIQKSSGRIQIFWDILFLASGVVLICLGQLLIGHGKKELDSPSGHLGY